MEFRSLVLKLLAQPLDSLCYPPVPTVTNIPKQVATPPAPRSTPAKRKLDSVTPSITPTLKPKIRHLLNTPKAAPAVKRDDGEIVSRKNVPVSITTRKDSLVDPSATELGARPCEVRTTTSELEVTRMIKEENGERVMEIRRVSTTVERVRWVAQPLPEVEPPSASNHEMDVDFTPIASTKPSTVYSHSPLHLVESAPVICAVQTTAPAVSSPPASTPVKPLVVFDQKPKITEALPPPAVSRLIPPNSESASIYPPSLERLGQDDAPRQLTV